MKYVPILSNRQDNNPKNTIGAEQSKE